MRELSQPCRIKLKQNSLRIIPLKTSKSSLQLPRTSKAIMPPMQSQCKSFFRKKLWNNFTQKNGSLRKNLWLTSLSRPNQSQKMLPWLNVCWDVVPSVSRRQTLRYPCFRSDCWRKPWRSMQVPIKLVVRILRCCGISNKFWMKLLKRCQTIIAK